MSRWPGTSGLGILLAVINGCRFPSTKKIKTCSTCSVVGLDEDREKALNVTLNNSAISGEWDPLHFKDKLYFSEKLRRVASEHADQPSSVLEQQLAKVAEVEVRGK